VNRFDFNRAYSEARKALRIMSALPTDRPYGRYTTVEERRGAEEIWIAGAKGPKAPAFRAVADSLHLPGTLSNAALHDYRFCGGGRRNWYLDLARKAREGVS
jgi:hypothetical protein